MPRDNNFLHARYSRADPGERVRYAALEAGAPAGSPAWREALGRLGGRMGDAGVRAVVLVYGSPIGADLFGAARLDDAGGLKRGYSRGIPGLESLLAAMRPASCDPAASAVPGGEMPGGVSREAGDGVATGGATAGPMVSSRPSTSPGPPAASQPPAVPVPPVANDDATRIALDTLLRDHGNFSAPYATGLAEGLSSSSSGAIHVERFLWSSRHHHLGRMEGALALFGELRELVDRHGLRAGDRVVLIAHGHAGQLPALLSNLLAAGESPGRDDILDTLASWYARLETPPDAARRLRDLRAFLADPVWPALDVVTLGTPIRYGWNTDGIGGLLHFVNHRPIRQDGKRWLARMELPQIVMELPMAAGGDYVHQLAVAGTDALPGTPWEEELNQALRDMLEPFDGFERWLECARRVTRCPNDGACLLVDYRDAAAAPRPESLFGHACYTRLDAMLFHVQHIADTLYGG